MRATEAQQRIEKLDEFISHAWAVINTMVEDPDHPEALDRHWREVSDNDVTLKLAQVTFCLEQFRSVPILEIPVGANIVRIFNTIAHALLVAQAALSRESQAPFNGDTARRISEGLWDAKMEAGRALLRTKAMAGATTRAARA